MSDRLADLSPQDWAVLGALAVERALPQSTLEELCPPPAMPAPLWLKQAQTSGLVVAVRNQRSGSLKPHYSVSPELEQRVLRQLSRRGELDAIAAMTRALLTVRSVSDLSVALQRGQLAEFVRRYAARKRPPEVGPSTRAEWLRRALCEPFDADWLLATFGDGAAATAAFVLEECAIEPTACDELYAWLRARAEPESSAVLFRQALLRGEPLVVQELPLAEGAAKSFVAGDLAAAHAQLDRLLERKREALPDCGALAPLLALLLCSRDSDPARAAAKRLLSASESEASRGALRALKTLIKYLAEPAEAQRRLDVHQLGGDIGCWELSILGLTVHLHSADKWARANWCQELVRRAREQMLGGYQWWARQTLFLAQLLNESHFDQEMRRLELPPLERGSRELVIWELISPKPDWQKALEALAQISQVVSKERARGYRVAWYVDMVRGELSRPALQESREGEGWSEGRRVSLSELWPLYDELPPEDQRVLDSSREERPGLRTFTTEAPEALIGHPRVVNGMRPRSLVDVARGTARIETREDRGYVQVLVEPPGAELGVNVVPDNESRLLVYRVSEAMFQASQVLKHGARIPKSHERDLLAVLGKLAESVEVRSPELGGERNVPADSAPCLRFAVHAGAWLVQLGVRPFAGHGRFFLAGEGRASLTLYAEGQRLRCERNLDLEREKSLALQAACPTLGLQPGPEEQSQFDTPDSWTLGEVGVLGLLSELRAANLECHLEWPESGGMKLASASSSSKSLHGRLRTDKGWYLVTGGVRVDDLTVLTLNELSRAPALANGRYVRLQNGDYLELEARVQRVLAALRAVNSGPRGAELRLPKSALHVLRELSQSDFEIDVEGQAWLDRVARLTALEPDVPSELRAELRPYQVEGFRWLSALSALGLGACLSDDMGLGKTVQILALLLTRRAAGPTLVVAPTSVCGNWLNEIRRFAPTLVPIEYQGKEREQLLDGLTGSHVIICSYTLLQQDQAQLSAVPWGTAVLDEAQFIKNSQSLRAKAAYSLQAEQRIAATGTPVENHLGDLWGIFRFLNPGLLGDWLHFKHTFLMPVERGSGEASTELLQKLVKPFLLRRLKRDVLADLPPITEVQHDVRWSEDEATRYAILRKQIHQKLYTTHGRRNNKLEILAELMRLRRFCCHPQLVFPDAPPECSKLDVFLELVEELRENQHRALVFSQFVDFLGLARDRLDERQIRYEYLDGSTPRAQRQERVAAFQEGDAPLFLISLKAGGFGLNLTAADYVIHLDPWWNPAVEAQATDRAHRIGQERPVTVYRLITKDSIEEKIVELHSSKRGVASALLDGGESVGSLNPDELLELVTGAVTAPA